MSTRIISSFVLLFGMLGCGERGEIADPVPGRWYTAAQVEQGAALYRTHCAQCHGEDAEATKQWRIMDENGNYPPPPLNGSAHAWHHPLEALLQTLKKGGAPYDGVMPGFTGVLSEQEMLSTIAFFQSYWSDDIYARWREIDRR